jgi:hypothetical protein
MQMPCFQHMPCAKKNWDKILVPHNDAMVHPTLMCLPCIINLLHNPHANIIHKHNIMQPKKNLRLTPMFGVPMGCHLQRNIVIFNVAYARRTFSSKHPTTPPNLCILVNL